MPKGNRARGIGRVQVEVDGPRCSRKEGRGAVAEAKNPGNPQLQGNGNQKPLYLASLARGSSNGATLSEVPVGDRKGKAKAASEERGREAGRQGS